MKLTVYALWRITSLYQWNFWLKAGKKVFLLFCLKEVQKQFNSEQFLKSHVFENSKFEKTEKSWPSLRWLSMNHSELKMLFEEWFLYCEWNYCFIVSNSPLSLVHISNYASVSKLLNRMVMVRRKALMHLAMSVFRSFK